MLQQDNVRPQTSAAATDAFARLGFTVLPHPAYCPHLSSGILTGSLYWSKTSGTKISVLMKTARLHHASGFRSRQDFF